MSPKKILVLTALVVALFAFIVFVERKMPTTGERQQKGDLVWDLPEDRIDSVVLTSPAGAVELDRAGPSAWRLARPDPYPADGFAASDLVSQLARLKRASPDIPEARPEDYGLSSPTAKATIGWKEDPKAAKKQTRTLEFGTEIPGTDATAARVAGTSTVLFVPTSVASAVKKKPDEFKSKEVFGSSSDAARLDVDRGRGRLSLEKKGAVWWLRQPISDLAESDAAEKLIGALTGLRVLEFVASPQKPGLASFGLAPPLYHVVLADAKGAGISVDFGATRSDGNSVYARRENQVFTVASSIVEDLSREAEAFRDPHLVRFDRASVVGLDGAFGPSSFSLARKEGGWSLGSRAVTAPPVDDLLSALLDVKSKSFEDEAQGKALAAGRPAATVTVRLPAGGEPSSWIVKFYPKGTETEATVTGRPGAFLIAGEPASALETAFQKAATAPTPAATAPAAPPPVLAPPKKKP
jgi:uncharacterized protein DUF4340